MKKVSFYLLVFIYSFSFAQKKTTISQALNIASKQSMLCERLAKEKVFKATFPNNYNVEQKLIVSLIQFERNISILKSFDLPKEILATIDKEDSLWKDYRKSLLGKDHESTINTVAYNNSMYSLCEKVFIDLLNEVKENKLYPYTTKTDDFPEGYIASNKLKKLSQKLSLLYNAYYSKVVDYNESEFKSLISDIDNSIVGINKLKEINSNIKTKTIKIENQWNEIKSLVQKAVEKKFVSNNSFTKPESIFLKSNELLKDADLLTRLYREQNDTK